MALDNNTVLNYTDKTTIKNWFKTGLKPTQNQFWSTWDSFWHKSESLPISSISGLGNLLDGKAETEHTHTEYATNDAASLTAQNITQWQNKLGINDLDYIFSICKEISFKLISVSSSELSSSFFEVSLLVFSFAFSLYLASSITYHPTI